MNFDRILTSVPVNRSAASVVSWRRGAMPAGDMTREELIELMERLQRKQRLLKRVLSITNKAQHNNFINAAHGKKYGSGKFRFRENPPAAMEYIRCGTEIQRINRTLQAMKCAASGKPLFQMGWKPF